MATVKYKMWWDYKHIRFHTEFTVKAKLLSKTDNNYYIETEYGITLVVPSEDIIEIKE